MAGQTADVRLGVHPLFFVVPRHLCGGDSRQREDHDRTR
jgi:hypothetical protein